MRLTTSTTELRLTLLWAATALLLAASGCTHTSSAEASAWKSERARKTRQVKHEDAEITYAVIPPSHSKPRSKTTASPEVPTRTCGMRIDDALKDFIAERVRLREKPKQHKGHQKNWNRVLERVDAALALAPVGEDLGAFVRAYATLSFELQSDRDRKVALADDVGTRTQHTLHSVQGRVEELRALGTAGMMAPMRRSEPGLLVLHPPVRPMTVTSPFGLRTDPLHGRRRFHAGIDVGARFGTMVYAAAKGWVVYAGWQGGYGNHVVIDHGDGVRTHYSHLHELYFQAGQVVEQGDTIGSVGATGRATGPHLHFAVTNGFGQFLDPQDALAHPLDTRLTEKQQARLRHIKLAKQEKAAKKAAAKRAKAEARARAKEAKAKRLAERLQKKQDRRRRLAEERRLRALAKKDWKKARAMRRLAKLKRWEEAQAEADAEKTPASATSQVAQQDSAD